MADIPNSEDFKNLNIEGAEFVDMLQQMNAAMRQLNSEMNKVTGEQSRHVNTTTKAVNLAKELSSYSSDDLANAKNRKRFDTLRDKALKEQRSLMGRIGAETKKLNNAVGKEKALQKQIVEGLRDQYDQAKALVERTDDIVEAQKELNKRTKFFDSMQDFVEDIPILRKFFPEFKKAYEDAQKAAAEGKSGFLAASKSLAGAASKMIAGFGIGLLIDGLFKVDKAVIGLSRNLNLTEGAARGFFAEMNSSSVFTVAQLTKVNESLNKAAGTAVAMGKSELEALATLTERMGVSSEAANTLYTFSAATGKNFEQYNKELIATVALQNQLSGTSVDYKAVMEDVAQAGAAARLSMEQFPGGIVKAAFQARKLGLNLAALDSSASSLLDFESSIEAELEAELLTGQELNLERARGYALTNNMAGLASELAAQGITQAKFAGMNRLAQEATAKALGMSREDMAQMFERQALLAKVSESDLNTKQRMQVLMEGGLSMAEAAAALGEDEFKMRKEQMTLEEEREKLMDRLTNAADEFLNMVRPLKGLFQFLIEHADTLLKIMLAIAAVRLGNNLVSMGRNMADMAKQAKNVIKPAQAAADAASTASTAAKTATSTAANATKTATTSVAKTATTTAVPAATSSGGGMWSSIKSFANKGVEAAGRGIQATKSAVSTGVQASGAFINKGVDLAAAAGSKIASSVNVLKQAAGWIGKNFGKVLKLPLFSMALEGFFAKSDIEGMIATATNKQDLYQAVGTRAAEAIGAIGGTALGGALGSLIPIPGVGTAIGAIGGDFAGRWVGGALAEAIGAEGLGQFLIDNLFTSAKAAANPELGLARGGIVVEPTRALVGEAGAEAVVPLKEFYAKFDELIKVVKEGGDVFIDGNKIGQALVLGEQRLR